MFLIILCHVVYAALGFIRGANTKERVNLMGTNDCEDSTKVRERMRDESEISERVDAEGNTWRKVYFGGGSHFQNWLKQCRELGEDRVEEVPPSGFVCYEETGEKLYRIWLKMEGNEQGDEPE